MNKEELARELEALQATYAAALPDRAAELMRALDTVVHQLGRGQPPAWPELEYFAHKLCGSSGTYGFKHLAAVAGYLEDHIIDSTLTDLAPPDIAQHLARWSTLFTEQARLAAKREATKQTVEPAALVVPLKEHLESLQKTKKAA